MPKNFILGSLIGRINLAIKHKKIYITEKNVKTTNILLKLLLEKHLISSYSIIENRFIIFLQYRFISAIKKISVISRPSKRVFLSNYQLKSLLYKNPNCFFLLSTDKGILYASDCLRLHIGGEILLKINL